MLDNNNKFSKDLALEHLTPDIQERIGKCIRQGFLDAHIKYASDVNNGTISKRTKSSLINDYIVNNINTEFEHDPRVHPYRKNGSYRLSIDNGAVIIRIKKLNKKGHSSNIPTKAALHFIEQISLFGPEYSINLDAGYVVDGFFSKVLIACPHGKDIEWTIDLDKAINNSDNVIATTNVFTSHDTNKRRNVEHRLPTLKKDIRKKVDNS